MRAALGARRFLEQRVLGKPVGVWLLWAAAAAALAACPGLVSDPGMWPYLLDPELLALVVVVGVQYARWEAGVLWLHLRARWVAMIGRAASREP